uniref:Uncharacterized protein n=1 Tax=Falco tinnunculus TaxID=100819 RepID=A0A8C4V2U0_FALTI
FSFFLLIFWLKWNQTGSKQVLSELGNTFPLFSIYGRHLNELLVLQEAKDAATFFSEKNCSEELLHLIYRWPMTYVFSHR